MYIIMNLRDKAYFICGLVSGLKDNWPEHFSFGDKSYHIELYNAAYRYINYYIDADDTQLLKNMDLDDYFSEI